MPFATLNKHAWESYATQTDPQLDYFVNMPDHLVLAKSFVASSSVEADVWDGITRVPIAYTPPPGYRPSAHSSVSLELGGPWVFYLQFYVAHGLSNALSFVKPQTALSSNHSLWVPLLLHNDTSDTRDLVLHASLPDEMDTVNHRHGLSLRTAQQLPCSTFPDGTGS